MSSLFVKDLSKEHEEIISNFELRISNLRKHRAGVHEGQKT